MTKEELENLKKKLQDKRNFIIKDKIKTIAKEMTLQSEDMADEGDMASVLTDQEISLSLRTKEFEQLKLIDSSLRRIEEGTYGQCLDCDETIPFARLNSNPAALFCIIHAEEREREAMRFNRKAS